MRAKVAAAIAQARQDGTPTLLDAKTYRYRGHSMSDPALYRTAEEVERFKHQDPILMLKAVLLKAGVPESQFDDTDKVLRAEAKTAVEFASSSPEPDVADLETDVCVNL